MGVGSVRFVNLYCDLAALVQVLLDAHNGNLLQLKECIDTLLPPAELLWNEELQQKMRLYVKWITSFHAELKAGEGRR